MERQHMPQGGEHQHHQLHEQPAASGEHPTDADLIHYGITEALRGARPIDHATARAIHGGQASSLYALASSGALVEGLQAELDGLHTEEIPTEVEPWLDALDEYLEGRADESGPIDGWPELWPRGPGRREENEPETGEEERPPYGSPACAMGRKAISARVEAPPGEDEAEARQALLQRINAAGVRTLGEVATFYAPDQADEPDTFPWTDAATWSPSEIARDNYEEPRLPDAEVDALFGEGPDEEVGSVDELGWYGLVKHEGRPGGLVLIQDDQGFRHVREVPDDAALEAQWAAIQAEYVTFYEQRDAFELATAEASAGPSRHCPRIWVGSLSDYNAGRLYGVWMDATLEPEQLQAAVQFMLRRSSTPGAEGWSIFDHDDFGGYEVSEWSSFATVSLVAQGIAEYGPAYAAWVNYVGDTSGELLEPERFPDHYLGEWDSLNDYVEDVLQETEFYRSMDEALQWVPEDLRRYVTVDVDGIADEWEQGLYVADAPSGKVWVFDASV
jgi:antirestriction protein